MSLSKKIVGCNSCLGGWLKPKDVKKFIKELKDELKRLQNKYEIVPLDYVTDSIDKLAGEDLI